MKRAMLIAGREFHASFRSPVAPIVAAGALLIDGLYFYWTGLSQKLLSAEVLQEFFYGVSGTTMAAAIFLSMRLLAEERQTGTITLLNTAPVKDWEIVAGKFCSAFALIVLITALTGYMPALILINGKVSGAHVAVGYLGVVLLGSAALAIGLFASAIARSQVIAIILGAAIIAPLILLWLVARAADPPLNEFLSALALHHENFRPFMVGLLEFDNVVYYLVVTYVFLLAATKILEARRWR